MLVHFVVSLALLQTVPIGSALRDGAQLVYESGGATQAPWVYDSVRVVEREDFDRCIITHRRVQPLRESCVRGDTLFERTTSNGYRAVRPIGPNMRMEVESTSGAVLEYETGEPRTRRIAGAEVSYLPTVIVTRTAADGVTRRLREHYAASLLTALWGVFEEPDDSGGWTTVREFSLVEVRGPATGARAQGGAPASRQREIQPLVVTSPAVLGAQQSQPDSVQRRPVNYTFGDVTIAATLLISPQATPAPGVVIVHGSGSSARDNPWTTAYAEALAGRGIAVLYPDKRGSGESTGDWRESSVEDLAGDVRAGVAFLRSQQGVDSAGVGILGFSQGGYVASVVAAQDTTVAFTAVISGGTASLRDQIVDELILEAERRNEPLDEQATARLRDVYGSLFAVAREPRNWAAYTRIVTEAKEGGGPLGYALRTMPEDSTHWVLRYLAQMGDFDPMPYWSRAETPAVFIYGDADTQVRVDASVERLRAAPTRSRFTIVTLGGSGHALFREDVTAFLSEWFRMRAKDG